MSIGTLLSIRNATQILIRESNQEWSSRRSRFMYSTLSAMSSRSIHMPAKREPVTERDLLAGASSGRTTSDDCALFDRHVLQGSKNTLLVSRGDRHSSASVYFWRTRGPLTLRLNAFGLNSESKGIKKLA